MKDIDINDIGISIPVEISNQVINLEDPSQNTQDNITINENNKINSPELNQSERTLANLIPSKDGKISKEEEANNEPKIKSFNFQEYMNKLFCFLQYLRPYFKITSTELKKRLKLSLIPLNNSFYECAETSPDLYGPFWIYTSLIYVIAASGAVSNYIQGNSTKNFFQHFVPVAGGLIYSIGFLFPLLLYVIFKIYIKTDIKYLCCLCIYGYSLSALVPVLILCSCGNNMIQWVSLLYGVISSTCFILINFYNVIKIQENNKKYVIIGSICGCQFILLFILRFYFFEKFNQAIDNGSIKNK